MNACGEVANSDGGFSSASFVYVHLCLIRKEFFCLLRVGLFMLALEFELV